MPSEASRGADEGPEPSDIRTRRDFAERLTALREAAGLTVRDIAKAAGLPHSTVGGYFSGRHLPALKPPELLPGLLAALGVPATELEQWRAALRRVRRSPGRAGSAAPPYCGLAGFQREDAPRFFGREQLTGALAAEVLRGGMFAVVGPSGAGKSSLLRAGLIPRLAERAGPVLLITPGAHPADTFRAALSALDDDAAPPTIAIDQFEEVFTVCRDAAEREEFIELLHEHSAGGPVCLALRADFYPSALRHPRLAWTLQHRQTIVHSMSDDELRQAVVEPARQVGYDVEEGLVELLMRDLGRRGGQRVGAPDDAGALPLLSHALLATWERGALTVANYRAVGGIHGAVARTAEEVYLTLTEDERQAARRLFLRLVRVADDMADTRRLVARSDLVDEAADETDRGVFEDLLDDFIEHRLLIADADAVQIAHEALLTAWPRLREWIDADRAGLRVHRRLSDAAGIWRESQHDPGTLLRGVPLGVATEWAADPLHRADLGPLERRFLEESVAQQQAALRGARRASVRLRQLSSALSILLVFTCAAAAFAFNQRTAADQQRNDAISRQVAIEADQLRSTDVALADQLAVAAYRISPTTQARESVLDSALEPAVTRILGPSGVMQAVAVSGDGGLMATCGANGSAQLWSLADANHPRQLATLDTGTALTLFAVSFSTDGRTLAVAGAAGTLQLWNVANAAHPVRLAAVFAGGPTGTIYTVRFSPDGRLLAAAGEDRLNESANGPETVHVWRMAGHAVAAPELLTGFDGYVHAVAFSADGRTLAAGASDSTVRTWTISADTVVNASGIGLTGPKGEVLAVAISSNGRTLAAAGQSGSVYLWRLSGTAKPTAEGKPLVTDEGAWINALAFDPSGSTLAVGSSDSRVWLWNVATPPFALINTVPNPAPVTGLAFLANGELASSSADATARIWHLPDTTLAPLPGRIFTVTFGPRHLMAVGSESDTVSLWNIADPADPAPIPDGIVGPTGAAEFSGTVAVNPAGTLLAAGSDDGTVRLWDIGDPGRARPLPSVLTGLHSTVQTLVFSPNGRVLAAGASEADIRLWDVSAPARPRALPAVLGPRNYVFGLAYSPDGRLLAAASADDDVRIWNVADPSHAVLLGRPLAAHTSYVFGIAFSPNGRYLAAGGADDTVTIWNVADPSAPTLTGPALTGPDNYIYSIAFSPDGRTLAAAVGDGSVWLWNIDSSGAAHVMTTVNGSTEAMFAVGFAPDEPLLAAGGQDHQLRIWNPDVGRAAAGLCAFAGSPITAAEWARYVQGEAYTPPCTD